MEKKKFYVTTAIDYLNSVPHLGHAYEKIAGDIIARYYRQKGENVYFLTGSDEHGTKVSLSAKKASETPKEFVDEMSQKYKDAWSALNVSYDYFVRTTDENHEEFVSKFLEKLHERGEIFKGKYSGLYCVGCEEYKIKEDLEKGEICPVHQKKCELVEEEIYFFKLSKYQKQLLKIIKSGQLLVEPKERLNEIVQFLTKEPLKDLAISRSKVEWGIKLPWDKNQTIYVWIDALLNYLSASKGYWPADLQIVGKDIFRFHAIIWPAMLLAGGYELPKKLYIHGFINVNSQKMSKTTGNVVDPVEIAKVYNADALRYFLFREVTFGQDGNFTLDRFDQRYQSDLANDLGNLFQRVLIMAQKYGVKYEYKLIVLPNPEIDKAIEELRFSDALTLIWKIINEANKKIDAQKPWELAKTDPWKLEEVLKILLDTLSQIAYLVEPFMPATSKNMVAQLQGGEIVPIFPRKK